MQFKQGLLPKPVMWAEIPTRKNSNYEKYKES